MKQVARQGATQLVCNQLRQAKHVIIFDQSASAAICFPLPASVMLLTSHMTRVDHSIDGGSVEQ